MRRPGAVEVVGHPAEGPVVVAAEERHQAEEADVVGGLGCERDIAAVAETARLGGLHVEVAARVVNEGRLLGICGSEAATSRSGTIGCSTARVTAKTKAVARRTRALLP